MPCVQRQQAMFHMKLNLFAWQPLFRYNNLNERQTRWLNHDWAQFHNAAKSENFAWRHFVQHKTHIPQMYIFKRSEHVESFP